ncbi:hypothetical protein [Massilia sp. AB1]|uniref:hypothetical protein n=1 Tax=Massilia sp. AB1 TaxID=2823371 RepID=UPI001B83FD4B|nr:hypothetical protein [Massilia sp. AB1]MBQ5939875.1 hypothetical protein [Massilia sp. AB1]
MHDHFFVRLARGSAPFVIWALHFTLCYGLAAAQCTPGGMRAGGPDRVLLGVATVVALAACVWLGWRARGRLREPDVGLSNWAAVAGAMLGVVAIAWNGIPLLLVAGCA